jgi:hypothetical protein
VEDYKKLKYLVDKKKLLFSKGRDNIALKYSVGNIDNGTTQVELTVALLVM